MSVVLYLQHRARSWCYVTLSVSLELWSTSSSSFPWSHGVSSSHCTQLSAAENLYKPTIHTAFGQLMDMVMHSAAEEPGVSPRGGGDQNQSYWRVFQTGLLRLSRQTCWLTEHANVEEAQGFSSWCHRFQCCQVLMSKRSRSRVQPESNLQTSSLVQDFQGSQIKYQPSFRADTWSNVSLMFPLTLAAAN